ncbi:MAG: ferritin family protein [Clostridia bacterium]|nr:ferritin family protein [Clostridia bacterium]
MQECPFGDLEGLRIAAEMEKRGGEFYRLAARVSRRQEAKDLLTSLAADEAVHLREFQRLYEKASQENRKPYEAERGAYLSALAAEIAFPEGVVGAADKLGSPEAILKHAIKSEEDSIRFYTGLTQATGCAPMASVFEDIIRQETGHLHRLQKMLSELT